MKKTPKCWCHLNPEPELPPIEVVPENPETDTADSNMDDSEQVATAESENITDDAKAEVEPAIPEPVVSAEATTEADSVTNQDNATGADVKEEKTAEQSNQSDQPKDEIADAISSLASDQPAPKPETPKIITPSDTYAPRFVVQFAAFKSETRAKNTAAVLATKHASRLKEITLGYMRRDNYWRVVTEPMPRADASLTLPDVSVGWPRLHHQIDGTAAMIDTTDFDQSASQTRPSIKMARCRCL